MDVDATEYDAQQTPVPYELLSFKASYVNPNHKLEKQTTFSWLLSSPHWDSLLTPAQEMDAKSPARHLSAPSLAALLPALASRFLHASEVYKLLHSFRRHGLHLAGSPCGGLRTQPPHAPPSGSWFLYAPGARLRSDGYAYEKRLHKA